VNRRILAAAMLAAAVFLLTCFPREGTSPTPSPEPSQGQRLIRAGRIRFSYDDQGRLSRLDSVRTSTLSQSYEFVYENDRLIRENIRYRYDDAGDWENRWREYEYDGRGFIKLIRNLFERFPDGALVSNGSWTAVYDNRGLISAFRYSYSTGESSLTDEFVYYLNGNLYEWRTGFTREGDAVIPGFDRKYEYDRGKNPFPVRIGDRDIFPCTDENNPVKITEIDRTRSRILVTVREFEYTYDDAGYPIHSLQYVNGDLVGETDYEYEPIPVAD
jgi:hypothetical protein